MLKCINTIYHIIQYYIGFYPSYPQHSYTYCLFSTTHLPRYRAARRFSRSELGSAAPWPGRVRRRAGSCSLSDVCQMSKSKTSSSPAHYDLRLRPIKTYVVLFAMCPPKCRPGAPKTPPRRSRDALCSLRRSSDVISMPSGTILE